MFILERLPPDLARYFLANLLNICIAFVFLFVHGRHKRMLLDFVVTSLLFMLACGRWYVVSMATVLLTHLILRAPRLSAARKTILVRVFNVGFTIAMQLVFALSEGRDGWPAISDYWLGSQMIMSLKAGSLTAAGPHAPASLWEFVCFCFDVNGSLSGGVTRLSEWRDWVDERWPARRAEARGRMVRKGLRGIFEYFGFSAAHALCFDRALAVVWRPLPAAGARGVGLRLLQLVPVSFIFRMKYYAAWTSSYAVSCATGFAFAPVTKGGALEPVRGRNLHIAGCEAARSCVDMAASWNILAAGWFREFVYTPLADAGVSRGLATIVTNSVSASWHGMSPGYHLFFALLSGGVLAARVTWRRVRPGIVGPAADPAASPAARRAWRVAAAAFRVWQSILFHITIASVVPCFVLLRWRLILEYLRSVWFFPIFIYPALGAFSLLVARAPHFKRWAQKRTKAK